MSRSDMSDYSDAYIVVKMAITVERDDNAKKINNKLTFKNNASFRSFLRKINNTFIDSADDLNIVMPMYRSLEYSSNYSVTSGSLWNHYRNEINGDTRENNAACIAINNNKTIASKSFEYKAKLIGNPSNNNNILDAEFVIPWKYLSNFPLINCEIEIDFSWSEECIISEISISGII